MRFFLSFLFVLFPLSSFANPATGDHIEVALHSEVQTVQAGESFWVALRLSPEAHWHTYWQNPGDWRNGVF